MADNLDGSYSFDYVPELVGNYSLAVSLNGATVTAAQNVSLLVVPAATLASSCLLRVVTPSVTSGHMAALHLQAKDAAGNNVTAYDDKFAVQVTAAVDPVRSYSSMATIVLPSSKLYSGFGVYMLYLNPTVAGQYTVNVTFGSQGAVAQSGASIAVVPGPTSAETSVVVGTGLALAVAGTAARFEITAKDAFGNWVDNNDAFAWALSGASYATGVAGNQVSGGLYVVEYTLNVSGQYVVDVSLGAFPLTLPTTPQNLVVLSDVLDLSVSGAYSPTGFIFTADMDATVLVSARDRFGNLRAPATSVGGADGISLGFTVNGAPGGWGNGGVNVSASNPLGLRSTTTVDNLDGTHTVTFVATKRIDSCTISVVATQGSLTSTYSAVVEPAATDAANSVILPNSFLLGTVLKPVVAGTLIGNVGNFLIQARDHLDNDRIVFEGESFAAQMEQTTVLQSAFVGSGQWNVLFVSYVAGAHASAVTLNGATFFGGFTASIDPDVVDAASCTVFGSDIVGDANTGILSAIAGKMHVFTIVSRDQFGNLVPSTGETFDVQVLGPVVLPPIAATAIPGQPGHYRAMYASSESGQYVLTAKHAQTGLELNLGASPKFLVVMPDAPYYQFSTASGPGLVTVAADKMSMFTVSLRDRYGNSRGLVSNIRPASDIRGGDASSISISAPKLVTQSIQDLQDGQYAVALTWNLVGTYTLTIGVAGTSLPTAWTVSVTPGVTDPTQCSIVSFNPVLVAGVPASFMVQTRDMYSNLVLTSREGDGFSSAITLVQGGAGLAAPRISLKYYYVSNGQYQVLYTILDVADYGVDVVIKGIPIPGSGKALQVIPAAFSSTKTTVNLPAPALSAAVAGQWASFQMTARDAYGNVNTTKQPDSLTFNVVGSSGLVTFSGQGVNAGSGVFTFSYRLTQTGVYALQVVLRGLTPLQVGGSTSYGTITVSPAAVANANASMVTGPGTVSGESGVPTTFTITAYDVYGNRRGVGGDPFTASFDGVPLSISRAPLSDVYTVIYMPLFATLYSDPKNPATVLPSTMGQLLVQVFGATVLSAEIPVSPGVVSAPMCAVSSISSLFLVAGMQQSFVVQTKDAEGNLRTVGGDSFVVQLSCFSGQCVAGTNLADVLCQTT